MTTDVYRKHNSFRELRHRSPLHPHVLQRVRAVADRLEQLTLPTYEREVIQRACRDLLDAPDVGASRFELQSYVLEEMHRLREEELPRYLFYRYRYEMYPQMRKLDSFPPCLQVEPASICNYRCIFCYQTDGLLTAKTGGHMGLMSYETFCKVIDEAAGRCEAITLASRGEPTINKDFNRMLAYAAGKFLAMKVNTNAWYLDEAKAHAILDADINTLVFSADAAAEPAYSQFRVNGKLDRILDNIRRFHDIRETQYPHSGVITRVSGVKVPGTPGLEEMESFWGDLVDQVAFVTYNPWENTYERAINDVTSPCSDLWRRMFVWWDGAVNPCDVDYRSTLKLGSFGEQSLGELWRSEAYMSLRAHHEAGRRGACSPCDRCTVV